MLAKTTKALVTALILSTASLALSPAASAAPRGEPPSAEKTWMDQASRTTDGAGF